MRRMTTFLIFTALVLLAGCASQPIALTPVTKPPAADFQSLTKSRKDLDAAEQILKDQQAKLAAAKQSASLFQSGSAAYQTQKTQTTTPPPAGGSSQS